MIIVHFDDEQQTAKLNYTNISSYTVVYQGGVTCIKLLLHL